ncbi:hypothetical protein HYH03_010408 [Edaphochlamys debaryana]|uniref:Uncharacterized protein n=1 Tax=Edaphochlamys debaryana TaxID=47281 RepID=A0A835XY70_9CHLO|nr:hypothetical protein HYH03_010408 [Edaphochlamys debaryana]|eukprot:KAG2491198.1 hypothetical protein HYH03_010408 [Edaphochlamys debaryana]
MALAQAASSAGKPLVTMMAQAVSSMTVRAFAAKPAPTQPSGGRRPTSIAEPTYTYMPPGSSMREPIYFSTSDPVYFVDPRPAPDTPQTTAKAPSGEEKAVGVEASTKKIDFSFISRQPGGDDKRKVNYKMGDEFSQQSYVVNPTTHSMREPKYVSINDPKYPSVDKK